MPWFRTFIRGEHFLLESDGQVQAVGFYATRFVEASGPGIAESAAVELIRADQKLRSSVRNDRSDPPKIFVDEIEEIELQDVPASHPGYTFFPEGEP
jgi:hypothetical protein